MAWIESHESLPSHPKTKRMCRILKISPVVAVGHLHFLWWWAMNHAQDGVLDRYTADDVADACSWEGDSGSFFNALIESEFIDRTSSGHEIHDWFVYAGKLIALRQKDALRKKESRGKKELSGGHPTDIQRTSNGSLTESIRDLDLNPNLNPKTKPIVDSDECDETFNQFWNAYPKKNGKAKAVVKWRTYFKAGLIDIDKIMNGLERYLSYVEYERTVRKFDRQYLDGLTFVNGERWNDEWVQNNVKPFKSFEKKEREVEPYFRQASGDDGN